MRSRSSMKRWGLVALLVLALPVVPWTTQYIRSQRAHAQLGSGYRLSELPYLTKIVFLVNKHYVDRRQIDPPKMFHDALQRIQLKVPAIMVRFDKANQQVEVRVDRKIKVFQLKPFPIIFSVPFQLRGIFSFIEKHYHGDVKFREIEFAAIHGLLQSLDPHTGFLPPSYYKDMQMTTDGNFGGLGIVIQNKDGYLTVLTPMPGTPASAAGIKPQDRIVRIGDESTINMSLEDAVSKLRGKPNTKVIIWIQRKGYSQPKRVEIIRALIQVQSVTHYLLDNKIGYIRVKHFQKDTAEDIQKALKIFHQKTKGMKGLILDLRNNPGGLLNQAIAVSDLFLKKGVIVSHVGGVSQREEHQANSLGTEPDYPMIVLVNRGSASASEIVAGALKNHNRALILGQQTHGKGTVQVLYPIYPPRLYSREQTALKLTIAQYLTPGGISIQEIGITPDIAIHAVHFSKDLVHFFDSVEDRKLKTKQLPRFLRGIREGRKPIYRLSYFDSRSDKERANTYREEYVRKSKLQFDFEIDIAHKLIAASKHTETKSFFQDTKALLGKTRRKEAARIFKALRKAKVNWSKMPASAKHGQLSITAQLLPPKPRTGKNKKKAEKQRPPKGSHVWAGSGFRLQITVRNRGKQTAYRVRAVSQSDYWFFHRKEFVFGRIKPGQTKRWSTSFQIPKWVKPQVHQIKVQLSSNYKPYKQTKPVLIHIHGAKRPRFDFSYALEELGGNGDSLIQPGESFALRVSVRNQGKGIAPKVIGMLKNKTGRELFIKTGRIQFGAIKTGDVATGWFYFKVKPFTMRKSIDVQLNIFDAELLTTAQRKIRLRVYPVQLNRKPLANRWVKVKEQWPWLYAGAAMDAPRVARANKGSILRATGQLGPFIQVQLPAKTWGHVDKKTIKKHTPTWQAWIPTRDIIMLKAKTKTKTKNAKKTRAYWQSVTPQIEVQQDSKPIITDKPEFLLKGNIRNNVSLLDAYILVNEDKVFYRALRNVPKVQLQLPIKLKKGKNRIIIVARESNQFSGYHEMFVYYKPPAKKRKRNKLSQKTK